MLRTSFDPDKPYRYVRYARMSTAMQNPRSPDQQLATIDADLKRSGSSWVHIKDYRDDAKSGRYIRKRPGFSKMLNDIKLGVIAVDLILVDTLERFGRMEDLEAIRRNLRNQYGVLVLTADSRFADPTSTAGLALGAVEAIRATSEAHTKAHNVVRGKIDAIRQGRWPGGPAPLGYKLQRVTSGDPDSANPGYCRLVTDPKTAPVVRVIFRLAAEDLLGTCRIAKRLNEGQEGDLQIKKINASRVGHVLDNPIYKGTLRFGRISTGVVSDRRVQQRNKEEDVRYQDGFCEPLVSLEVWDQVRKMREKRGRTMKGIRASKRLLDGKRMAPLAPGIVTKYPLSGIIRCHGCGAAMRPCRAGATGNGTIQYCYYRCPGMLDGRCSNRCSVRADWLWQVVVARIREQLFPLPAEGAQPPAWLDELVADVRAELRRRAEQDQGRRPLLQRELDEIAGQIEGWTQSLANSNLQPLVRGHIESQFATAMTRRTQLEAELEHLEHQAAQTEKRLDVGGVIDRLRRLHDILVSGNATVINVELLRHIEDILVSTDGRVIMRTHRLGVFEGLTTLLGRRRGEADESQPGGAVDTPGDGPPPRLRPLPRRRVAETVGLSSTSAEQASPLGDVVLPERWMREDVFEMPSRRAWSTDHATEVAQMREEKGWSQAKIARHFGKSQPTIRKALQVARKRSSTEQDESKK